MATTTGIRIWVEVSHLPLLLQDLLIDSPGKLLRRSKAMLEHVCDHLSLCRSGENNTSNRERGGGEREDPQCTGYGQQTANSHPQWFLINVPVIQLVSSLHHPSGTTLSRKRAGT